MEMEQYGAWSELQPDMLLLVIGCLGFVDQLAMSRVCRSWRSIALAAIQSHRLLWEMRGQKRINWVCGSGAYKFVDPWTGRSCNKYFPELRHCYFLTARHGWLLVAGPSADTSSHEEEEVFRPIFFHPFSRTMIILPYLYCPHGIDKYDLLFDFTAPPTSPECIVFAIKFRKCWPRWTCTCKQGGLEWASRHHKDLDNTIWLEGGTMVFSDGLFFCADRSTQKVGSVLAFDPRTNGFKDLSGHHPRCADHDRPGELVLCRRLDPDIAADMLNRLDFVAVQNGGGGGGLGRDFMMEEGLIDESCYPETFAPFRLEEGGQFAVRRQSTVPYMDGSRVWIRLCFARPASSCWVSQSLVDRLYSPPKLTPCKLHGPPLGVRLSNVIIPFLECLGTCLAEVTGAKDRNYG